MFTTKLKIIKSVDKENIVILIIWSKIYWSHSIRKKYVPNFLSKILKFKKFCKLKAFFLTHLTADSDLTWPDILSGCYLMLWVKIYIFCCRNITVWSWDAASDPMGVSSIFSLLCDIAFLKSKIFWNTSVPEGLVVVFVTIFWDCS